MSRHTAEYNVQCHACGRVWSPQPNTPLWRASEQRARQGYLDALCVTGERCGCTPKAREPNAPFRVFGYDFMREFDMPFGSFTAAVKAFRNLNGRVDDVFISGVSRRVEERLCSM